MGFQNRRRDWTAGGGRRDFPATMAAAILVAPEKMEIREAPIPVPEPGQVRVRNEGCGICASNLEPWTGPDWMTFPTRPGGLGHEAWGVIDAVGDDVDPARIGERVATLFQSSYAEYDCGPAHAAVPLPGGLEGPFPGEPLACAMNVFERARIEPGQTVAIIGIGFLGAILTRLASQAGAKVIALSRRGSALEIAEANGAAHCLKIGDRERMVAEVRAVTGDRLCDRVIEVTGKAEPLDLAGELTAVRGTLVIAGYHQDGPRLIDMQLWNWRGLDVINAHEREEAAYLRGMRRAIEEVASGRIDLARLVTHRLELAEINDGFAMTRDRPPGFLKAVVMMPWH